MAAVVFLVVRAAERERQQRVPRVFRDRRNPLDYFNDEEVRRQYRLTRHCILELCDILQNELQRQTRRSCALPVSLQIVIALRYLASGSFQAVTADVHGVSQPTVSVVIKQFVNSLCAHRNTYIQFPQDIQAQRLIKMEFRRLYEMPNVLGAVDGTLIPIQGPSVNEPVYICRKGYHAINVQGMCDAKLIFTNVVVKWPGRTHDAFIWNECEMNRKFEAGELGGGYILGDSGYPLRPWLLTPILNPRDRAEERYNTAQRCSRSVIERAFGVLKSRCRCLHKSGGCLTVTPDKCCKIILACFILHNICVRHGIPVDDELNEIDEDNDDHEDNIYQGPWNDGRNVRDNLVRNHFAD